MSKEELFESIINACSEWESLDYIAQVVNRNVDYLLNNIIPIMLERVIPMAAA